MEGEYSDTAGDLSLGLGSALEDGGTEPGAGSEHYLIADDDDDGLETCENNNGSRYEYRRRTSTISKIKKQIRKRNKSGNNIDLLRASDSYASSDDANSSTSANVSESESDPQNGLLYETDGDQVSLS